MNALYFKKLTVNSLRGVEWFEISEFGEQLNVIYGPNGEGKSLTGKSLQTLIWPKLNSLKDPKLWTEFVIGNDRWEVNLVGDEPDWKLNGHKTGEGPQVPTIDTSAQHWLGVQELLSTNGTHHDANLKFAQQIDTLYHGGVDLGWIAKELNFRSNPTRPKKLEFELRECRKEFEAAQATEKELDAKRDRLGKKEEEENDAREAARRIESLRDLLEILHVEEKVAALEVDLKQFDDHLEKMKEDDIKELEKFEAEIQEIEDRLLSKRNQLNQQENYKKNTGIENLDRIPDQRDLDCAEKYLKNIRDESNNIKRFQEEKARYEGEIKSYSKSIANVDDLDHLDSKLFRKKTFKEIFSYSKRRRELEKDKSDLSDLEDDLNRSSREVDELDSDISLWINRLKGGELPNSLSFFWGSIITASFILSIFLFWKGDFGWGVVTSVVAIALLVGWRISPSLLNRLNQGDGNKEREKNLVRRRKEEINSREQVLKDDRYEIEEALQGLKLEGDENEYWLDVLGSRVDEWWRRKCELEGIIGSLECAKDRFQCDCDNYNRCLEPYFIRFKDCVDAEAQLKNLRVYHDAQEKIDNFSSDIKREEGAEEIVRKIHNSFLKDRGFKPEEGLELKRLYKKDWKKFEEVKEQLSEANKEKELLSSKYLNGSYGSNQEKITYQEDLEKTINEINDEIKNESKKADKYKELLETNNITRHKIAEAEEGRTIEVAFNKLSKSKAELDSVLLERENELLGNTIIKWIEEESAERFEPEILKKANEELSVITYDRYQLDVRSMDEVPTFFVKDLQDELEKELDVLSAGERVQVLLAVRLGFLRCSVNDSMQLPLILDEVLGTTDDIRAETIIDTIFELVSHGRQVFYLTARKNEVAKWKIHWEEKWREKKIDYKEINLSEVRNRSNKSDKVWNFDQDVTQDLPDPNLSYSEYGKQLYDRGLMRSLKSVRKISSVDLFYLMDNTLKLHTIRSEEYDRWGPFSQLIIDNNSPIDRFGLSEQDIKLYRARSEAIEFLLKSSKIGRPDPVDRAVLKAVSLNINEEKFKQLSELIKEVGGDGAKLIEALQSKKIKRWKIDDTDTLEEYFTDNGYIDPRKPWGVEELEDSVLRHVTQNQYIDLKWLKQIIGAMGVDQIGELE